VQKETKGTIRAVTISCKIIEAFQELNDGRVTELADYLDHSKSTIHEHLATLEENRMVVRKDNEYRLSLRFLDIAEYIREEFENYDIIQTEVEKLANETGEVAQFGIEEHGKVSYLYKSSGSEGVVTASRMGSQQPMHSTALGKVILAWSPEDQLVDILETHGLHPRTENTITDLDTLVEELNEIRKRGYAIDNEENVEGLRCVAAPVMDDTGVFGSVSISGPASRFHDKKISELADETERTANVIDLNSRFS
jgi:DNA-binding IclR family transcriptional regulator